MATRQPLSFVGKRWVLAQSPLSPSTIEPLPPVAQACLGRRLRGGSAAQWLRPSLSHLHDPQEMLGMAAAVDRLRRAVRDRERVRIVTDYDVDGTTSSLLLQTTLRMLGMREGLSYHIPDRFDEGYGFSVRAAQKAAADGVSLVITADIGVRDHAAVTAARSAGVDVIVCDHHLPDGGTVPEDASVVLCPPQPGCDYPNPALAACGVSLKLAQAMLKENPRYEAILRSMLKIAAIGTVADVVDLGTAENRAIVSLGLEELRRGRHTPGLQALLAVSGVEPQSMSSSDLGFRIGPRINAAGRIDSAMEAVELLLERDPVRAEQRAQHLDQLNRDRQGIQKRLVAEVLAAVPDPPPGFVVAWGPEPDGWHRGVVGIVAARVRDQVHRPAAVVAVQGDTAVGSVRSVPSVHAVHALDSVRDKLLRYGGHPVAAGFSVRTADLPEVSARLAAFVDELDADAALVPELTLDACCPAHELTPQLASALEQLAPFGKGNPEPRLLVPGVLPEDLRPMGKSGKHLRFRVAGIDAVWWSGDRFARDLQHPVDLAVKLGFNHWRGRRSLRLTVEDARPATALPTPDDT